MVQGTSSQGHRAFWSINQANMGACSMCIEAYTRLLPEGMRAGT
jgi:hypothetical protein